jgi:O-methyltransferase involved in polyketide biosynthesis
MLLSGARNDWHCSGLTLGVVTAGWDAAAPTVFLAEGLTRYLKPEVLEAMFRTAAQVRAGSFRHAHRSHH